MENVVVTELQETTTCWYEQFVSVFCNEFLICILWLYSFFYSSFIVDYRQLRPAPKTSFVYRKEHYEHFGLRNNTYEHNHVRK